MPVTVFVKIATFENKEVSIILTVFFHLKFAVEFFKRLFDVQAVENQRVTVQVFHVEQFSHTPANTTDTNTAPAVAKVAIVKLG